MILRDVILAARRRGGAAWRRRPLLQMVARSGDFAKRGHERTTQGRARAPGRTDERTNERADGEIKRSFCRTDSASRTEREGDLIRMQMFIHGRTCVRLTCAHLHKIKNRSNRATTVESSQFESTLGQKRSR